MTPDQERSAGQSTSLPFVLRQAILVFLFLLPFIVVLPSASKTELPQWLAATLFSAIAAVAWLFGASRPLRWTPLHTLVMVVLGGTLALSLVHAGTAGVQTALIQQVTLSLFFLLGGYAFSTPGWQMRLLQTTVFSASLAAAIGLAQHLSGTTLGLPATSASASVFINKNYAGAFMNLATPAALVLLLAAGDRRGRILGTAGFLLCLGYSLVTLSRGHWLALAAALGILLILLHINPALRKRLLGNRVNQWLAALVIVSAPALLLLPNVAGEASLESSQTVVQLSSSASIGERFGFYRNTLQLISERPLTGVGPGAFYTGFRDYYATPSTLRLATEMVGIAHAHDDYLEYLAELGIPVGLGMILLLGLIWYSAWRMASNRDSPGRALAGTAFLLGITAILGHALVDFPLSLPVSALYLWTWAGAISAVWLKRTEPADSEGVIPPRRLRVLLGALGLFYLALVSVQGYRSLRANILILDAARATVDRRCDLALPWSAEARDLQPDDYLIWSYRLSVVNACGPTLKQQFLDAALVLEQDPNHPYALLTSANALYRAGDMEGAASRYRRLIELLPHRISGYLGLANTLMRTGREDAAREYYDEAETVQRRAGRDWYPGPAARTLAALTVAASGDRGWAFDAPMRPLILKLKIVAGPAEKRAGNSGS